MIDWKSRTIIGIGVRSDHRAQQVMGIAHIADPVADGLVNGVFQGAAAGGDRAHLGAGQLHADDVGRLPLDIFFTHVDDAFQPQHGADGGCGHPVLAGPGLGDNPGLAHALGQQPLPQGVIYLVRAGMGQVFAL